MRRIRHVMLAVVGAATLLWSATGSSLAADQTVEIDDLAYAPPTVTIQVGDTVTWVNGDDIPHTATDTDGSFDTEVIDAGGDTATVTFDTAGTSSYACSIHPQMTGTVVVEAAGAAPTAGAAGATAAPTDTLAEIVTDIDGPGPLIAAILIVLALLVTLAPARLFGRRPR